MIALVRERGGRNVSVCVWLTNVFHFKYRLNFTYALVKQFCQMLVQGWVGLYMERVTHAVNLLAAVVAGEVRSRLLCF